MKNFCSIEHISNSCLNQWTFAFGNLSEGIDPALSHLPIYSHMLDSPPVKDFLDLLLTVEHGKYNDFNCLIFDSNLLEQRQSIHIGHINVREHDI